MKNWITPTIKFINTDCGQFNNDNHDCDNHGDCENDFHNYQDWCHES